MVGKAIATRKLSAIKFREDLYPRIETSATTVQKYAEDLDVLPPIEINQHDELIDGWHRWTAHKKEKADTISVVVTETKSDIHLLELAIERNATHGLQLSRDDKRDMGVQIYNATPLQEQDAKKKTLAKLLSVSERTVSGWLSRIDKDNKAARNRRIFDLWLACWTQQEIADEVGVDQAEIARFMKNGKFADLHKTDQSGAEHATDFKPPYYNIWKQQTKSAGSEHFGNTEITILDNLLYLYSKPFDIIVDPFAGGGSTIDLCRKRFRRYWVGDRKPIVEREKDIREHDMTNGLPSLKGRWGDVKLVYLDPPYWKQAAGKYSKDKTDLANMTLEEFNKTLAGIITSFSKQLTSAYIALIIQPTQWNAPKRQYTDHVADMLRAVKLPVDMRYSVPYESQQCNAQMVEWAKEHRKCLVLTRELIVWRIGGDK